MNSTSGAAGRVPVGESLRFAVSLCCHPIRGFTEMKYEKRGRLWLATAFLCLWIFTNVFEHQVTNFLFNLDAYQPADILAEIRNVVLITLLFVLGNWSVTTLMDGEGSLKDIYMVIGYASLPLSIIRIPLALLTNLLSFAEKGYVDAILALAWALFFVLLFLGVLVVHQYTVFKTVVTTVLTLLAIGIMIFIAFVFISLGWQMAGFVSLIGKELQLRL
ncbi:MAG: YIP1 family protein [Acutalibacteraceae bacterium]